MSQDRPQTRSPSAPLVTQDGTFAAIGTVSRCPATTTRSARPSSVRATTTLPSRTARVPGQGPLDLVGDSRLVAADRLDVAQRSNVTRSPSRSNLSVTPGTLQAVVASGEPPGGTTEAGRLAVVTDPAVLTEPATQTATRSAWGWGLATVHGSAGVLDTYFPAPALGRATDEDVPADLASAQSRDELRKVRPRSAGWRSTSTLPRPTPRTRTCGCICSAIAWSRPDHQPGRDLRLPAQRGVDLGGSVRGGGLRVRPSCCAPGTGR